MICSDIFQKSRFALALSLSLALILTPAPVWSGASVYTLPAPSTLVSTTSAFVPVTLKGLHVNPGEPFRFDFILQDGQQKQSAESLGKEGMRQVNYFLAALTLPQDELWVNLSPFEKNRIIPDELKVTRLGRDLLLQDYLLKQLSSSLSYPEGETGKIFWKQIYQQAVRRYGRVDVPVETFDKVWIVPEKAQVFVKNNTVIVTGFHLKVMMEADYLAAKRTNLAGLSKSTPGQPASLVTAVMREVIVPVLEKEVNEGKHFILLRQIVHAVILAEWYKRNLKNSLISRYYANQHKITGIDEIDASAKEAIYRQYVQAYKKGAYNFIREDSLLSPEVMPRKYFAGGMTVQIGNIEQAPAPAQISGPGQQNHLLSVVLDPSNKAMIAARIPVGERTFSEQVRVFFRSHKNPYLTDLELRLKRLKETYAVHEIPPEVEILSTERFVKMTEGLVTIPDGQGSLFHVRVSHSAIMGPAKGGIRWLTAENLMDNEEFKAQWNEFLALNPREAEVEYFIKKWIREEAKALGVSMTLKTAGLDIGLGGAKGAVFIGRFVRREETWVLESPWNIKDKTIMTKIARAHLQALMQEKVVGIDTDSPAPDMNTNPGILEWYEEFYLRELVKLGETSFSWNGNSYKKLYQRLLAVLNKNGSDNIEDKFLIKEAQAYAQEQSAKERSVPVPWLGVFTGKTPGFAGVAGRGEATGEGVVQVMKSYYNLTQGDGSYTGKTMAIQAFGNVGSNTAIAAARDGFKVVVINDAGITLYNKAGWIQDQLQLIAQSITPQKGLKKLWEKNPELFPTEVKATLGLIGDKHVFEAVIGANVDILVPAFMERQITKDTQSIVKARELIVEAANGPVEPLAEELLFQRGIKVIPDTLANAGGVVSSGQEMLQWTNGTVYSLKKAREDLFKKLHAAVQATVEEQGKNPGITIRQAFDRVALNNINRLKEELKALIALHHGELNLIRQKAYPIVVSSASLLRTVRNLDLTKTWTENLKKGYTVIKDQVIGQLRKGGFTDPNLTTIGGWIDTKFSPATNLKTLTRSLEVLRTLLAILREETVSQSMHRLGYAIPDPIRHLRVQVADILVQSRGLDPSVDSLYQQIKDDIPRLDDKAMSTAAPVGGIDLNTEEMAIEQQGAIEWNVPFLSQEELDSLQGLSPVFLQLVPFNLPQFLNSK